MKIDRLNAAILKELLEDGRKSFTEIAQKNECSEEVIANRYKQMKKQGIIVGATIQNSYACYGCNLVAFIAVYTQSNRTDNIVKQISEIPHVHEVHSSGINPSCFVSLLLKNLQEIEQTKQAIKGVPSVSEVDTRVILGIRNTPDNLSVLTSGGSRRRTVNNSNIQKIENAKIADIDKSIIERLAVDARIPFSKIGEELKVSTDTVARRYEKLKHNGDLKAVIQINPTKLGYRAYAIFNLTFSKDNLSENIEVLSRIPDINFIHKTSGKFDCIASLLIKDIDHFTRVQEDILKMPSLTNMELSITKMFDVWPIRREFISTF
jgi:Lrp/AsnC family leucine-responsive transcriptional regulator